MADDFPLLDPAALERLERKHAGGITSADILDVCARHGIALSEATLRKYVQLGLLPRSVRVGRKGKHQGSQGLYPASVLRQIVAIRQLMAEDLTIEQIAREVLFLRADLQELEQALDRVFRKLDEVLASRRRAGGNELAARELAEARTHARELLGRLARLERRLGRGDASRVSSTGVNAG